MSRFLDLIQGKPISAVEVPAPKKENPKVEIKEEAPIAKKEVK